MQRPSDRFRAKTAADGSWDFTLWANYAGDFQSFYTFKFPNISDLKVWLTNDLPPEIEFSQLLLNSTPPTSPDYPSLIALINSQLAGSGVSFPSGGTVGQTLAIAQATPNRVLGWINSAYIHQQSTEADRWIVNHNLGYRPSTEVLSLGGEKILAEVLHVSESQTIVYWSTPKTGFVRCN